MRDEAPPTTTTSTTSTPSRFDDVERAFADWETDPGAFDVDDQGLRDAVGHDPHGGPAATRRARVLMSRVFSPKKMNAEDKVREFCARSSTRWWAAVVRLHRRPRRPDADAHDRPAAGNPGRGPGGDPRPARRVDLRGGSGDPSDRRPDLSDPAFDGSQFAEYIDWAPTVRRPHDPAAQRRVRRRDRRPAPARRGARVRDAWRGPATRPPLAHRLDRQAARRAPRPAETARRGPASDPERDRGDPALRGAVACRPAP